MREIKFRAWDKEDKKWLSEDCMPIVGFGEDKILSFGGDGYAIFEQYTGLKDKKGKEIYEGDIVSSFVDENITLRHVVEWSDRLCGWYMRNILDVHNIGDGSIQAFVYFNNTGKNCEVCGNIHQPEGE